MTTRASGVILHITSLPGPYGMGTLGAGARQFVDFLEKSGQTYWQILPLVNPGEGDSPYMSCSCTAGNILLIDPDMLYRCGLLTQAELDAVRWEGTPDHVDFDFIHQTRHEMLCRAYARADAVLLEQAERFAAENADWLEDYALYMAISDHFRSGLQDWPDVELKKRTPAAVREYAKQLRRETAFYKFAQYLFFDQWHALKTYANARGIRIIGDIPIYVSPNSVDVWTAPELFLLDTALRPTSVAGVPPDIFSADGQLWGNPLYDWAYHEKTGYAWWLSRIRHSMAFYDKIRIDHFRGFSDYWEVPAGETTALGGAWRDGPRMKIIRALLAHYPKEAFIAEDLGVMTDTAIAFLKEADFAGMRVLVDSLLDSSGESDYAPHGAPRNCVIYTSTHDTPTFIQWFYENARDDQRRFCLDYLRSDGRELNWSAIACAWSNQADTAITTMQDLLCLGADARMNVPGTVGNNWNWRVRAEALNDEVAGRLLHLTRVYGRLRENLKTTGN